MKRPGWLFAGVAVIAAGVLFAALQAVGVFNRHTAPGPVPAGDGTTAAGLGPTPSWIGARSSGLLTLANGAVAANILVASAGTDGMALEMLFPDTSWFSPVDAAPDKEACRLALMSQRRTDLNVDVTYIGRWWCLRTNDGYSGAIQVREVTVAPPSVVLAFVLWT